MEDKKDNTSFKVLGLGALGGFLLGSFFILVPKMLYNHGVCDPAYCVEGGLVGSLIGAIAGPYFYFRHLKEFEVNLRMFLTVFFCVFFLGMIGFLVFPPIGVIGSFIGFRWACDVLKDESKSKEN